MQTIAQNYGLVNVVGAVDLDSKITKSIAKYISMKGYSKVTFILTQGSATDNYTVNAYQAKLPGVSTSSQSISATALPLTHYWTNLGSTGATPLVRTSASSSEMAVTSANNTLYVLEYDAKQLDQANGYDCIGLAFADNSTASNFGSVIAILHDARYAADGMPINALAS